MGDCGCYHKYVCAVEYVGAGYAGDVWWCLVLWEWGCVYGDCGREFEGCVGAEGEEVGKGGEEGDLVGVGQRESEYVFEVKE